MSEKGRAKKLSQRQRRMLEPETRITPVVLMLDGQGNICGWTPEQHQQWLAEIQAQGDEGIQDYLKEARAIEMKNPQMRDRRAKDAMSALLHWAIASEWCNYNEWLSPVEQEEMLNCFYDDALDGIIIEQAPFKKKRSKFTDKAYEIAKPHLLNFRQAQGIPNNQPLTGDQGREAWSKITSTPKWKRLVTQHAKEQIKKLTTDKDYSIQYQVLASSRTLRVGADNRWKEEFSGDQ
jgi:hypothetical protein